MNRRLLSALPALLGLGFVLSCTDQPDPIGPTPEAPIQTTIADAPRGGVDPNFFWLPPTVPSLPKPTGPFDDSALNDLSMEICQLDAAGKCTGTVIERFSTKEKLIRNRIRVYPILEFYAAEWLTILSEIRAGQFYRVRVLRKGTEIGYLDVQVVKTLRELKTVDTSRYAAVIKGEIQPLWFRLQRPTARTSVKINEVESNGGTPGDWIELHNTAAIPVSVAGYVLRDNDDTHSYAIPAGTTIPAGGFLVVEEANLGFGLGSADAARLYTPTAAALVDSYEWTAQAATTYGRCPDGTGAFQTTTAVTKGTANDCSVVIRINEVESNGGTPGDWVELYNPAPVPRDLAGYVFKDSDDTHGYVLPAGTTIPAGGYLVLDEAAFGFGLGAADAARLFRPGGVALVDSYEWTAHAATTYGRCPDGTGAFGTTSASTKGVPNLCGSPITTTVKINEVESSGGTPGDWVELYNTGAAAVDLSGYVFKDNDDTHAYVLPAGTTIAAGGFFLIEEAAMGFGLGSPDAARLFAPDGTTVVDSYNWTPHATTTYGRCPNGTGAFGTTTSVTKGAVNDCGVPIKINEVESSDGTPGDWVELYNPSANPVDISGFVFRDNDDTHNYVIPAGTTIAGNGYYLLEEAAIGFGLGGADAARLFAPDGTSLIDSYQWTAHATTTYGRCTNGTGDFTTTTASTKGAANACPGEVSALPWPGDAAVQTVDGTSVFGGNMSGLAYEGSGSATPGVLWAARNGPGTLFRLVWNGTIWTPDPNNGWTAGKALRYPDGAPADPDAEGVAFAGGGSASGLYVATERNNQANGTSRNSVLRFDPAGAGTALTATNEWNLTADLPAVGANTGLEAVTWIPDAYLVAQGFFDESKGHPYAPADYANHAGGIFFVGVEANGVIYGYALNHSDNSFTRVATIASGFIGVMDLTFDRELEQLWAVCDDGCGGRSAVLTVSTTAGPTLGRFVVRNGFERPATMPNLNNEGFSLAPQAECVGNRKPAFWSDDTETDGHAIRQGTVSCTKASASATVARLARRGR